MKKYPKWLFHIIIIIGFLIVLYWVEFSSFSSQGVSQYNGGYGTFDMKTYNVQVVKTVLESMDQKGYEVSYRYYIGDYLFILFFGLLQGMISKIIFHSFKSKNKVGTMVFMLSILIPIFRGIADIIENTMLIVTLIKYPKINMEIIEIAQISTQIKMECIKLWVLLVVVGLVIKMMLKCKSLMCTKK